MSEIAIQCDDVTKTYKLYQSSVDMAFDRLGLGVLVRRRRGVPPPEFRALHGINLKIVKGERVGIVGRNGAGKSTLLRMIGGAATSSIVPTEGKVAVNGVVHALMSLGSLNSDMTGRANARSSLVYNGVSGNDLDAVLKEIVDFVELGDFIDRPVQNYSLGMSMRLNFAVATALYPDILLIDEVLGAGDARFARKAAERMRRMIHSGCTSVLVSHSLELIEDFCDRVIWLKDGAIALDGPTATVLAAYNNYSTSLAGTTEPLRWARVDTDPPAYARSAFVRRAIAEAEGLSDEGSYVGTSASTGVGVRRFAARQAKINDVRMFAKADANALMSVGNEFRVEIDVEPIGHSSSVLCALEIFTLDGRRVARIVDDQSRVVVNGMTISVDVDQFLVGAREYFVTVALLDPDMPELLDAAFDVISQSLYIRVSSVNDSDPPFVHLPAKWRFGSGGTAIEGRISSVL